MPPPRALVGTPPLKELGEPGSLVFEEGSRPRLAVPKSLVAKLWREVQDGVRIVPRGGIEVGGLLVGPKTGEGGIIVDNIVPVSIKYQYGPSFRMSTSDLADLAVLVESVRADSSKTVLGLYRSQTRGSEIFRDSDREIFAAIEQVHMSFAEDFLCFVVVAPVSISEMSASIAIRHGENWERIPFTLRSDPFSATLSQPYAEQDSATAKEQLTQPSLVGEPQESLPSAEEHSEALAVVGYDIVPTEDQSTKPSLVSASPEGLSPAEEPSEALAAVRKDSVPTKQSTEPSLVGEPPEGLPSTKEQLTKPSLVSAPQKDLPLVGPRPLLPSRPTTIMDTRRPSNLLYALAGVLALFIATEIYLKTRPAQASISSVRLPLHMGFTANREGSLWRLSWDRNAVERIEPRGAILAITDGRVNQQLNLTPADLSSGAILYMPHGSDLLFSLQLHDGFTAVEEDIRVFGDLGTDQKSGQGGSQTPHESTILQAKRYSDSILPTKRPSAAKASRANDKKVSRHIGPTIYPSSSVAETPVGARSVPSLAIAEPKNPNDDDAVSVAPVASAGSLSEQPDTPTPSQSLRPKPAPAETTPIPASSPAAQRPASMRSGFIAPVPVRTVPAQPPPGDFHGIIIRIRMGIDDRGRVTTANAVEVTAANAPLVSAAERAALSWQFEPATIGGHPVPSQLDLLLRF